ncbi:taste receptor type 2 member 4-like [Anomaloglossus baeobatrachus]|uniref:taste receptor type 2 member 4-like n=1 Tax=Anomaloglossus baeobatrachus TaxID=238106 RepID=UPI003F5079B7
MESYLERKYPILHTSLLVTTEIAFIVGLMTHAFIVSVNLIDWRSGRTMTPSDQVITSIMISRMILQSVLQLSLFLELFCAMCSPICHLTFRIICFSSMYSSIWLSTLLCVVFFVKISNFRSVVFLWFRKIISERILLFILFSFIVSLAQTSMIYLVLYVPDIHHVSVNSTRDNLDQIFDAVLGLSLAGFLGPLLILLLSSVLLMISLYFHIKRMKCNGKGTCSVDVYYQIITYTTGSIFTSALCVIIHGLTDRTKDGSIKDICRNDDRDQEVSSDLLAGLKLHSYLSNPFIFHRCSLTFMFISLIDFQSSKT